MVDSGVKAQRPSVWHELFEHGPIWFVFLIGIAVMHYEAANVPPENFTAAGHEKWRFLLTALIPFSWVLIYYFFRVRDAVVLKNRRRAHALISLWILGFPLLLYLVSRPKYLPEKQLVMLYEYTQFLWLALMVLHAWFTRGAAQTVLFFGVCFLYGMGLENMGIIIGFFGESQYQLYLGLSPSVYLPAPVATQVGWCIMFYISIRIAEYVGGKLPWLRKRPLGLALLTAFIAVTIDLQIDPLASLSGLWWRWDHRLPAWFLGVPFLNFVAWFTAFLPFSFAYFFYARQPQLTDWQRTYRILVRTPWMLPACVLLGAPFIIINEGGWSGPAFQIAFEFLRKVMTY